MQNVEMTTWLYNQLTQLDYRIRDIEQSVVLSDSFDQNVVRSLCHLREKCEDAAVRVRH